MEKRFTEACEKVINVDIGRTSIGILKEKTLHRILKHFLEPNEELHEIKLGRYHADIVTENEIIEIQTRNFNTLRNKLNFFLDIKPVRIVYPLISTKYLVWIDPDNGEVTTRRKSPKTGKPLDCFFELYKIKMLLNHENIRLSIITLDAVDYRTLNGYSADRKKGSTRYERIPERIISVTDINCPQDYALFLSTELPEQFSSKDVQKTHKVTLRTAQVSLNVLHHVGAVKKVGKKGNTVLYQKANDATV